MAVMMKPYTCPGQCVYCPLEMGMPKSYLSDEPAAQRAKSLDFDPVRQIQMRLEQLEITGHPTDKLELIVIGGTFSAYPEEYKRKFFLGIFGAVNGRTHETLVEAQKFNETAPRRVVGISVETRPDWVTEEEVKLIRELGVTKIQLGVQAFDEKVLRKIKRGHDLDEVRRATRLLRNAGVKICYHFMPGLPESNPENDIEMSRLMYSDEGFKPDYVKIYPCMVIPGTELHRMYERGEVQPYSDEILKRVLKEVSAQTPEWVRVDRLVRDISKKWVASGSIKTNMRQEVEKELIQEGRPCRCIRCREVKEGIYEDENLELRKIEYQTDGGREIFLAYENDKKLYALLRLRLPNPEEKMLFPEIEEAALIREVHAYGQVVPIAANPETKTQHRGLGRRLIEEAEKIANENGFRKIAVISAIGTHEYYRKWGYELEGLYMTKDIS